MDAPATFDQASDCTIAVTAYIDNVLVPAVAQAKYQIFDKDGIAVVTKTLGAGISFSGGVFRIDLTDADTLNLAGSYKQECLIRTPFGQDHYILKAPIRFTATKVRF